MMCTITYLFRRMLLIIFAFVVVDWDCKQAAKNTQRENNKTTPKFEVKSHFIPENLRSHFAEKCDSGFCIGFELSFELDRKKIQILQSPCFFCSVS